MVTQGIEEMCRLVPMIATTRTMLFGVFVKFWKQSGRMRPKPLRRKELTSWK